MKSLITFAATSFLVLCGIASIANAEVITYGYPGYDSPTDDFENVLAGNSSNCARNCLERSNCSAATFDTDDGRCWMKTRVSAFVPTQNSILIVKILSGRTGVDYPGGDYRNYQASDWVSCSRTCFVENQCAAYTFDSNTKTCWLKSQVIDATIVSYAISGRK